MEVTFLRDPKNILVIIRNIRFELLWTFNDTFILNQGVNTFLPIDHTMEVSCIRVPFENKLAFRPLILFEFLLPEKSPIPAFHWLLSSIFCDDSGHTSAKASKSLIMM
jgi:hypothetical protein